MDGQRICLSEPPQHDATAIFEPTLLTSATDAAGERSDIKILKGIVSRLTLEKTGAQIVATILVGNLPFTLKLSRQQMQQEDLYPGRKVRLNYNPHSVKWL